ncbi:hypothetical protein GCM10010401_09740 [Rarobacter faecitabidus]|uniref:Leucine rich repeat variant domain-containing protein n=1 Tax=Rarobacter faecitabidus TaxID=13243 RepID=A0A542ZAD7_RARFA|nr:hypothetical protein [Rarobacter faecitabidus]TQL57200.1 hypothetical protein FB461_2321 [Rarobacter faecitabidus]
MRLAEELLGAEIAVTDDSYDIASNPATDPDTLLALLSNHPQLGFTIASHPRLTDQILHELTALDDRAVDSVLVWRQAPADGWRRPLRPGGQVFAGNGKEAPVPREVTTHDGTTRDASGVSADTAASAGRKRSGGRRSRRHTRALVGGLAAVLILTAGTAWWLGDRNSRDSVTPPGPIAAPSANQPDAVTIDPLLEQKWWLRPYPTAPEVAWRVDRAQAMDLARTVQPSLDQATANLGISGSGDRGLLAVSSNAVTSGDSDDPDGSWVEVDLGIHLASGELLWAINPSVVTPGEDYLSCTPVPSFVWCRNASDTKIAVIDNENGFPTVFSGDWSRQVGDTIVRFTANGTADSGAEGSTRSVTVVGERLNQLLWETEIDVPADQARLLTRPDFGTGDFVSPVMISEPVAGSGLYAVQFRKEGACYGETEIDKDRSADDPACLDDTDAYYVGIAAATGEVVYSGTKMPIVKIGENLLVQDPAATVVTQERIDTDFEAYSSSYALHGSILAPDGTTLGDIDVAKTGFSQLGELVSVSGDHLAFFHDDAISVYSPGHFSEPSWTAALPTGTQGYSDGFIVGPNLIVGSVIEDIDAAQEHEVTAYNLEDGLKLWHRDARLLGTDGVRVIVNESSTMTLQAISLRTGLVLWESNDAWGGERQGSWLVRCQDEACEGLASGNASAAT